MSWIAKALELAERYVVVQERQLATREARDKELSDTLKLAFASFEKLMPKMPPDLHLVSSDTELPKPRVIPLPAVPPKDT
jgi:hypothetical protein